MRAIILALVSLAITANAVAQSGTGTQNAVQSITPEDLQRHIAVIAADSMLGRNTPSIGLDLTADYIAGEFEKLRLDPAGDNGEFVQRYPITEIRPNLEVLVEGRELWRLGSEVLRLRGGTTNGPVAGPVVVVTGSGELSQPQILRDAIVILAADWSPQGSGLTTASFRMLRAILRSGPTAIFLTRDGTDRAWNETSRALQRPQFVLGAVTTSSVPPQLVVRRNAVSDLLDERGIDLSAIDPASAYPVPGLQVTLDVSQSTRPRYAPNVVGVLHGSDDSIKDEYVVICAHMDHLGIGTAVDGDSIYNGADDNASGTAGLIEAAQAFVMLQPRPRRSLIFLAVSGEEKGLWGSTFFVEHSPVPMSQVVAAINMDMIGRNWPDTILAIGKESSDLGDILDSVSSTHPELAFEVVGSLGSNSGSLFTSDHASFAAAGVPALFFFNGTHEDYHGVDDEVDKIDTEKASRIVKLLFHLSIEVANSTERPRWR